MNIRKMTKDGFSTLCGLVGGVILGAAGGAATAVQTGGINKDAILVGAGIGAATALGGFLHNRGNSAPVGRDDAADKLLGRHL